MGCGGFHIKRDPDRMIKEIREKFIPDPEWPDARDGNELTVAVYRDMLPEYEKPANFTVENDGDEQAGLEKLIQIVRGELGSAVP